MFPVDSVDDFLFSEWNRWVETRNGKKMKMRTCNRETCTMNMDCDFGGKHYQAGEQYACVCLAHDLPAKQACSPYFSIKLFVCDPTSGAVLNVMPYRFENHSVNSRDAVVSELEKIVTFTAGHLVGIRFVLSVKMVEQHGKVKKIFPVWALQALGSPTQVLSMAQNRMLPINEASARAMLEPGQLALPSGIEENNSPAPGIEIEPEPPLPQGKVTIPNNHDSHAHPGSGETGKRARLVSAFTDHGSNFEDRKTFVSRITLFIKRNWDGKTESLSDDELEYCNKRFSQTK